MAKDYCQEISDVIYQYRLQDRKNGSLKIVMNKSHVERWVEQFDKHEDIVLQETFNLLNNYYFKEEDIDEYLKSIYTSEEIWGSNIDNAITDTVFLNCQTKGNSQDQLIKKSRIIISNLYNIDIRLNDFKSNFKSYVYVDDCMFSGNTLRRDIQDLIERVPNGSIINAIFISVHSFADWWVNRSLKEQIDQKDICFKIWRYNTIQNSERHNYVYECLWPKEYNSYKIDSYIKTLKDESAETPEKKVRFFRNGLYNGGVYTSELNRMIFEQELMEAGLKIIEFPEKQNPFMRPMGYDNRISFGFGAFFSTYMNMSNNCPLAFWWGDANAEPWHPFSKWYPLLPRKANDIGGDMIVW